MVEALRSGNYKQGKFVLRTKGNQYCCLGVLCDLAVKQDIIPEPTSLVGGDGGDSLVFEYVSRYEVLPVKVMEWAGVRDSNGAYYNPIDSRTRMLSTDNDEGKSFEEIADIIEREMDNL